MINCGFNIFHYHCVQPHGDLQLPKGLFKGLDTVQ